MQQLTDRSAQFEFGKNWRDYAKSVDRERIDHTTAALRRMFLNGLEGKTFIDIGNGSGIRSLAALELGASSIRAVDIDENSAETTRALLTKFAAGKKWTAETASVFDLTGQYDVVFSWGVLHHTGDMWRAIEHASRLVKPGGVLAISIYTQTPLCSFWKVAKRLYSNAPRPLQFIGRAGYTSAFVGYMTARGINPIAYFRDYAKNSDGMTFTAGAHDWLGGFPYESASVDEMKAGLRNLGLHEVRTIGVEPGRGIWSAAYSEYIFASQTQPGDGLHH